MIRLANLLACRVPILKVLERVIVADVIDEEDGVGAEEVFVQHAALHRRAADVPQLGLEKKVSRDSKQRDVSNDSSKFWQKTVQ